MDKKDLNGAFWRTNLGKNLGRRCCILLGPYSILISPGPTESVVASEWSTGGSFRLMSSCLVLRTGQSGLAGDFEACNVLSGVWKGGIMVTGKAGTDHGFLILPHLKSLRCNFTGILHCLVPSYVLRSLIQDLSP